MITEQLLEAAKEKIGARSYYEFAKKTGISEQKLSSLRKGRLQADEYTCFKLAEILERSPSSVIAEIRSETEKDEDKRLYFKRFFSIAVLWITLGLLLPVFSTNYGTAEAGIKNAESRAVTSHNAPIADAGTPTPACAY
ncbi:multidrug transporter [Novimethylophilus kurashikiensis]|uniref:Multidrug transporter n=1 Tax=Novimethylophilus kurashikiensis TaxID=1825523 RepID=A0A2R5F924_9PROT|nr:helix-turn-helix transcriptional regulator [Novimethylophilus kurashikiensis]GBG13181.1 multidrug transporter [Novimethylophilus kurashikiensis]